MQTDADESANGLNFDLTGDSESLDGLTVEQIKAESYERHHFYTHQNFWVDAGKDGFEAFLNKHKITEYQTPDTEKELHEWDGIVVNPQYSGSTFRSSLSSDTIRAGMEVAYGEYKPGCTVHLLRVPEDTDVWMLETGDGYLLFDYDVRAALRSESHTFVEDLTQTVETSVGLLNTPFWTSDWVFGFKTIVKRLEDSFDVTLTEYLGPEENDYSTLLYGTESGDVVSVETNKLALFKRHEYVENPADSAFIGAERTLTVGNRGMDGVDIELVVTSESDAVPVEASVLFPEESVPQLTEMEEYDGDTANLGAAIQPRATKPRGTSVIDVFIDLFVFGGELVEADSESEAGLRFKTYLWSGKEAVFVNEITGNQFDTRADAEADSTDE